MDARLKHSGMTFFGIFIRLNTYIFLFAFIGVDSRSRKGKAI
jgi:hypothetical protein